MIGTNQLVKVTLRNPMDHSDLLTYEITTLDTSISAAWYSALKQILINNNHLEKNFCFLGFPNTARDLNFLCNELNSAIEIINKFNMCGVWQDNGLSSYVIEEWFHPNVVRFPDTYTVTKRGLPDREIGLSPKHQVLNQLHNHFEKLQGTVSSLSMYYKIADYETKYAIRQLNNICHEMEGLILSQRKATVMPEWVRPSQITTFLQCSRYPLADEHRAAFANGYDRHFGHVYLHWSQIGKTLFEVWRDEGAPMLTNTVCEAITSLQYYSGEFDVEWGNSVYSGGPFPWHTDEQVKFNQWLISNGLDPLDTNLSLGYLPLGNINCIQAFGTDDPIKIREILGRYLDIYSIEINGVKQTYDYCWTDPNHKQQQITMMKPGYDFSSRR